MSARTRSVLRRDPASVARRARSARAAAENAANVARFRRQSHQTLAGIVVAVLLMTFEAVRKERAAGESFGVAWNVGFVLLVLAVLSVSRLTAIARNYIPESSLSRRRRLGWQFAIATTAGFAVLLFWHKEGTTLRFDEGE